MNNWKSPGAELIPALEMAVPYIAAMMPEEHREWWRQYFNSIELRHPDTAHFLRDLFEESWMLAGVRFLEPKADEKADEKRMQIQTIKCGMHSDIRASPENKQGL